MDGNDAPEQGGVQQISKSQRKRESQALQVLGKRLTGLKPAQLAVIPLPEQLREAVAAAQRIGKGSSAGKRQLQYIGKIMRSLDPTPIEEALAALERQAAGATAEHHRIESWRDRLIAEGDGALEGLLEEFPRADRQRLRQLVRSARQEKEKQKPPRSARELFRYLRDLQEE